MKNIKRRLIKASQTTDVLLELLKSMVSIEQMAGKLKEIYDIMVEASNQQVFGLDSMQSIEQNGIDDFDKWFEEYSTSIVSDCINNAKVNAEFLEKYNNLQTDEINEFKSQLIQYIQNEDNKEQIKSIILNNEEQPMSLDNLQSNDVWMPNEYSYSQQDFGDDFATDDFSDEFEEDSEDTKAEDEDDAEDIENTEETEEDIEDIDDIEDMDFDFDFDFDDDNNDNN